MIGRFTRTAREGASAYLQTPIRTNHRLSAVWDSVLSSFDAMPHSIVALSVRYCASIRKGNSLPGLFTASALPRELRDL